LFALRVDVEAAVVKSRGFGLIAGVAIPSPLRAAVAERAVGRE
jgi:hypothetical protein